MPNVYIDASGTPGRVTQPNEVPFCAYSAVFMDSELDDDLLVRIHKVHMQKLPNARTEFKSSAPCRQNILFMCDVFREVGFSIYAVVGLKDKFDGLGLAFPEPCNKWFIRNALTQIPQALR